MLQRVMIAGALTVEPKLLLCDEPTTALDVTTQAEILHILKRLQAEREMGLLFITHDLDLAAAVCDRVYVMYAGQIVENASAVKLFGAPAHPYTAGLLAATPDLSGGHRRLVPIKGAPSACSRSRAAARSGHDVPTRSRPCAMPRFLRWSTAVADTRSGA